MIDGSVATKGNLNNGKGKGKKSPAPRTPNDSSSEILTMHGCPSIAGQWTQSNSAERKALMALQQSKQGPSVSGVSSSSDPNDPALYPSKSSNVTSGKRLRKAAKNDSDLSSKYSAPPPAKKPRAKKK